MKRVICILLICLLLCGCTPEKTSVRSELWAMDTYMALQFWGDDAQTALEQTAALLRQLEDTWSAADPDSLVYHPENADASQQALLSSLEALSTRTGGAFDPKMGAVSQAWGFLNKEYRVPDQAELTAALQARQWDMGAAMKGFAGRQIAAFLAQLDVDRALLNLGGNVQTYGEKPDGDPWSIGIQNPWGGDYIGVLEVEGTASVITSGDYQRYFEKDGVRYHHILDPKTGCPADTGLTSVTVICRDGLTGDALSTALFVMGLEEGSAFWRQSSDFEAVFILSTGEIYATEGARLSGCEYEVIYR